MSAGPPESTGAVPQLAAVQSALVEMTVAGAGNVASRSSTIWTWSRSTLPVSETTTVVVTSNSSVVGAPSGAANIRGRW